MVIGDSVAQISATLVQIVRGTGHDDDFLLQVQGTGLSYTYHFKTAAAVADHPSSSICSCNAKKSTKMNSFGIYSTIPQLHQHPISKPAPPFEISGLR